MNGDPNNIEKWLQNYAKQRRADLGKPLDMDGPTREMLLSESRRVWPSVRATQSEETSLWPQWVFATACAGVIACAIVYISQPAPPALVAKNNADSISPDQSNPKGFANSSAIHEKESLQLVTPFAPLIASKKADFKKADTLMQPGLRGMAGAAPAATSAIGIAGPGSPSAEAMAIESFREQFSQIKSDLRKENVKLGEDVVLRSFQYEQTGANVRVTDADGSVYFGNLTAEPINPNIALKPKQLVASGKIAVAPANTIGDRRTNQAGGGGLPAISAAQSNDAHYQSRAGEYNFQVVGTNRSLKQRVVFYGQIATDNLAQLDSKTNKAKNTNEAGRAASDNAQGAMQYRIRGQAVIGSRNQEVDAQPIPAPRNNQKQ